jgi:hypothetical protein
MGESGERRLDRKVGGLQSPYPVISSSAFPNWAQRQSLPAQLQSFGSIEQKLVEMMLLTDKERVAFFQLNYYSHSDIHHTYLLIV